MKKHDIAAAIRTLSPAPREGEHAHAIEDAWQELLEKGDRTSPAEYPDMALITFDEFAAAIRALVPAPRQDARLAGLRYALAALTEQGAPMSGGRQWIGTEIARLEETP